MAKIGGHRVGVEGEKTFKEREKIKTVMKYEVNF